MFSPALFLLIAALFPFAGFLVLAFIGKRLGAPLAGWVGTAFVIASFASTLVAMIQWYEGKPGQEPWGMGVFPMLRTTAWIPAGNAWGANPQGNSGFLDIGVYVDSLTIALFATVTLVAAIVHIFAIGFMRHEEHFARFFACLNLATFSMLGLAIAGTLLQLLIFWQIIGLCTALLIGYAFDKPPSFNAALRTYIVQLVGDCGLLVGVGILFCKVGNLSLPTLWTTLGDAAGGHAVTLAGGQVLSTTLLTLTGICLVFGAIARSAQFPLHVWISDAGGAPIPASALICTTTTAMAGIFLMGRLYPILTPDARLFIAIIGLVTLTMAALIALAQDDLPRMLVWTAVSQFGFMMLGIGVGSWIGGLFHLITAAFSLALLFLAAGSVIAAAGREQRLSRLGGLWRRLPVTAGAFAVAVLAITGAHFLSERYSQSILTDAAAFASYATRSGRAWGYWLFFALPTGIVCLTAFYLARCWMLLFAGKPRGPMLYEQAREMPILWGPILALAVPALIAGMAMNVRELLASSIVETRAFCNDLLAPVAPSLAAPPSTASARPGKFTAFDQTWPLARRQSADKVEEGPEASLPVSSPAADAHERGHRTAPWWVLAAWVIGILLGAAAYRPGFSRLDRILRRTPLRYANAWLSDGMYFDELYYWTLGRAVQGLSLVCYALDRHLISAMVDGLSRMMSRMRERMLLKK
jgi:NADH:ubiquinone oxidoreductase subunit 5 (subunit L)/multisubunit Na+/H+ antiporter MnhA subunit